MGDAPTGGQLSLLYHAIGVLVIGALMSLPRLRTSAEPGEAQKLRIFRTISGLCFWIGAGLAVGVLVWHSTARGSWQPLKDNFSAFLWLGLLLMLFVAYMQKTHPLRGLEFFIMPIVLMLLGLAAVFGKVKPQAYHETTWLVVHLMTAFGGFVAFAIAGAAGGMYLIANARLRTKKLQAGQGFGSLERLEHITRVCVTLGFALLTVGLVTGLFRVLATGSPNGLGREWYGNPKVVLTFVAWVVYALILHSPINPAFRGRRTAVLSIVGFVLMTGALVAVQFVPDKETTSRALPAERP